MRCLAPTTSRSCSRTAACARQPHIVAWAAPHCKQQHFQLFEVTCASSRGVGWANLRSPAAVAAAGLAALALQASAAAGVQAQPISSSVVQQEPQTQQTCTLQRQPQADLAGLFESQKDDIDPFTLYGTNFKKYQIEQMEGEKVVSRSRGFTVDSCVSAVLASQETPEFNGLPTGEKVQAGDGLLCKRATGPDLGKACKESCASACTDALARYEARMFAETGFKLEPKERERVLRNCRHSCSYECTKSGKAHDFVVPYRR